MESVRAGNNDKSYRFRSYQVCSIDSGFLGNFVKVEEIYANIKVS